MKMKKLHLLRPEVQAEISRPILGRLKVFLFWLKCIRLGKMDITMENYVINRLYYLCIPKIKVVDGS